ncbi:E3 ubiquitin/ISG15 ligase TRIM25-like [Hemibagrus wyckioides]|uniref:E3 ubiquitin/ISG15 ligase TRIM25-like n=1 Tax=Hemibagrus wyckioides TaxID=337641 RepID=UPI00266C4A9C|nr:E3 ubiquitin/ISG15 ligase TRIM25-like [Hemibagrus wyckioides]
MAEASISVDQDQFICPVCLDLLKDPVTTPCGHSFCKVCINGCWDQEDQKGVYSCPQCRDTFTPRPVLRRNNMLAEVVEKLKKKTEVQAASPAHCYTGPGDVECDFCTGRKHKAIKSCLMCLASFCETHLKPHYEVPGLKKHTLVAAFGNLQEKICRRHDEVLKVYCRTDQSFICYLCMTDEHKSHDTVSVKAYRTEKESELMEEQMKSQQRIQAKQKKVQELKQAVNTIKISSQIAVEENEIIFTEMISSMEKKRSEVTELIRAQEKAELSRAERLLEQLEQEIADLQRRVTELEQLSHIHDHIQFLQEMKNLVSGHRCPTIIRPDFQYLTDLCEDSSSITVNQHLFFDRVRKSLSDLKKRLEEEFIKIPEHAEEVQILLSEPKSREEFLKCTSTECCHSSHNILTTSSSQVADIVVVLSLRQFLKKKATECRLGCSPKCWERTAPYTSTFMMKGLDLPGFLSMGAKPSKAGQWLSQLLAPGEKFWAVVHKNVMESAVIMRARMKLSVIMLESSNQHRSRKPLLISKKTKHRVSLSSTLLLCKLRKMAEASISVDQDQFSCPVCLDLLKDPATIPCGHSFCTDCINGCWDQEDQKGVYSCPQCRDTFTPRPVLRRNNMLAEVVEKLKKKTEVQAASPAHCYSGPGDVECDFCPGRKHKAVKSCLVCVASLCETHLKPHLEIPALKKHKLVEASGNLQEKICSEHDEVLEMMDEHKSHDTSSVNVYRTEKESELKEEQMKFQQRIQEKQKKVQELKQAVNTIKFGAQKAVEENEIIFTEMISSMEKKRSEVTELIRAQEKAELSRAERLLEQLEQEIADLQRRVTEMEQLSHTHDHIHFLQEIKALVSGHRSLQNETSNFQSDLSEDVFSITVNQYLVFDGVRKSLSDLKKLLEDIFQEELIKIPEHGKRSYQILLSEPKSREEFLKYFCDLTLDPNTVNYNLILSEKNRVVTCSERKQRYSDHPERFDSWEQVLSKESVCGRCYWEVEWSSERCVYISVSYKDIRRKGWGIKCGFGRNNKSWSLDCSSYSPTFHHNNIKTNLRVPSPSRIGVYVDHSAGLLSFYSVSDTMKLLHRVHTTFTRPLYAGFRPYWDFRWKSAPTVRLCDPEK